MTQPTINALLAKLDAMRGQTTITKHLRSTQRANDFAIWRAGSSVNWECSSRDIATETGVAHSTVLRACKRYGWKLNHDNIGGVHRYGVDTIMAHPRMAGGSAT